MDLRGVIVPKLVVLVPGAIGEWDEESQGRRAEGAMASAPGHLAIAPGDHQL